MIVLRSEGGDVIPLTPARWHGDADGSDVRVLANVAGPVLDIGCGPGRVLAALGRRGVPALGVDPAPAAVDLARRRGAAVLQRSVWDRLPGEGRWRTVILFDGNVGIGGDAVRLLRRCRNLIAPAGSILVELEPPTQGWRRYRVRLEHDRSCGPWFPWVVVGADAIGDLANAAGLRSDELEEEGGRWFARLRRADVAA